MNLDSIKNSGARLGLEAELNVQQSMVKHFTPQEGYEPALTAARNCVTLLKELVKIVPALKPKPVGPNEEQA